MYTIALRSLHLRTNFSLLLWKLHDMGSFWACQKICGSISFHFWGYMVAKSQPSMAKLSPKVRISRFSGFHGNIFPFWWILVHRPPKAYLRAKYHVSSPDGCDAIAWVTNLETDNPTLYIFNDCFPAESLIGHFCAFFPLFTLRE